MPERKDFKFGLENQWAVMAPPATARKRFFEEQTLRTLEITGLPRLLTQAVLDMRGGRRLNAFLDPFKRSKLSPFSSGMGGMVVKEFTIGWSIRNDPQIEGLVSMLGLGIGVQGEVITFYNGSAGVMLPLSMHPSDDWRGLADEALQVGLMRPGRVYAVYDDLKDSVKTHLGALT